MARETKQVEVEGKNFKISEVPPIEAQKYKLIEIASHNYRLSQMGAYDTRRVALTYVPNLLPKAGDYSITESLSLLLMKYVEAEVKIEGKSHWIKLDSREMVEQHVPPTALLQLEYQVIENTTGFFSSGICHNLISDQLTFWGQRIIEMLMAWLAESSQVAKLPSEK